MPHLRPHPTQVSAPTNIAFKKLLSDSTDAYTVAHNTTTYCDVSIFNKLGYLSDDHSGVGELLRTMTKPVIFFTSYDVRPTPKYYIRHIVCCVATSPSSIVWFDMRNLDDISPGFHTKLERDLARVLGVPSLTIHNMAEISPGKFVYLQRFKGEQERGWCIAWALFFLNRVVHGQSITKKAVKKLYSSINASLQLCECNHPIEEWYVTHIVALEQQLRGSAR